MRVDAYVSVYSYIVYTTCKSKSIYYKRIPVKVKSTSVRVTST